MHSTSADREAAVAASAALFMMFSATQTAAQPFSEQLQGFMFDAALVASQGFERVPALMLALAVFMTVPLLAMGGAILTRNARARGSSNGTPIRRFAQTWTLGSPYEDPIPPEREPAWPQKSWIELEAGPGQPGVRHDIGPELVRIGRDVENDVCLNHATVGKFHAAIYRNGDSEFFVRDLTGGEGHGVWVNGQRTIEARLSGGDTIVLGARKITFFAEPA